MAPLLWRFVAVLALIGAAAATVLPLMPAIPFLLLAGVAASRGWPWLDGRLSAHPKLGPALSAWREHGALPPTIKRLALASLAFSGALAWLWPGPAWVPMAWDAALLIFGAWLWTRPSR